MVVASLSGCGFPGRMSGEGERLGSSPWADPAWAEEQGFADDPRAVAGAAIFAQAGCTNCHTYLRAGSANVGAPDLSTIGRDSRRGAAGFAAYVANPSNFGNDVMPRFEGLGRANLMRLGAFLEASKGPRGR